MHGNKCHGSTTYPESSNEREKSDQECSHGTHSIENRLKSRQYFHQERSGSVPCRGNGMNTEFRDKTGACSVENGLSSQEDHSFYTLKNIVRSQSDRVIQTRILKVWVRNLNLIWSAWELLKVLEAENYIIRAKL